MIKIYCDKCGEECFPFKYVLKIDSFDVYHLCEECHLELLKWIKNSDCDNFEKKEE